MNKKCNFWLDYQRLESLYGNRPDFERIAGGYISNNCNKCDGENLSCSYNDFSINKEDENIIKFLEKEIE